MKKSIAIIAAAAAGVLAGMALKGCDSPGGKHLSEQEPFPEIDTVTFVDTVRIIEAHPIRELSLGTRVTFLPVFVGKVNTSPDDKPSFDGTDISPGDSLRPGDNLKPGDCLKWNPPDSVAVEIPIVQREYAGENYRAWVSGYDPKLDSVWVYPRHERVTVRESSLRSDHNISGRRWGIGVFAGYGFTPHGLEPCAGISINYNLWNF